MIAEGHEHARAGGGHGGHVQGVLDLTVFLA
jgi:hypothetical protein